MASGAIALLGLLSITAAAGAPLPPGALLNVTFSKGTVTGVQSADVVYFLAIPYAASTEGANSFAAPAPRAPWSGSLNGTVWGAGCLQPHHNPDVPPLQSFDCLSLNIFAPPSALLPESKLPVMVFFNGGAYLEGSDEGPFGMYSGSSLVTHNVIIVSVNYRLGAYGWLGGLPELGITGNFGILDQIAGLKWVRDEIAAVGGDPQHVTVFGESAGAMSIGILLTSPAAAGLFQRAIMESNVAGFNYPNSTHAAVYAASFCSDTALKCETAGGGCNATCLRAASPAAVMSAWNTATGSVPDFILTNLGHVLDGLLGTGPIIDGIVVVAEPLGALAKGDYWAKDVPILLGTNSNEGETFIYDGVDFPL
jgi:para-nitrobenzyl esterase